MLDGLQMLQIAKWDSDSDDDSDAEDDWLGDEAVSPSEEQLRTLLI